MNGLGMTRTCLILMVVSLATQFLIGCKQGDGISLGNPDDDAMGANIADTLTVEASTFLLDPLPTTGQGALLAGRLSDQDLGEVRSLSYFRLSNEQVSLSNLPDDASYDSLSISLFYNGYAYGDTTQAARLHLHRVIESIEPYEPPIALEDDEYPVFVSGSTLLADREFQYESQSLGSVLFTPRPNTVGDSVLVRLADSFGQTLFDMVVNNDSRLTVQDDFNDFLKGLVLVPAADMGVMIGFRDSISFNIHYSHESQDDGMRQTGVINFPIGASTHQFNHIVTDRSGTSLAGLSAQHDEMPAADTRHQTYVQGSAGIVTRLRFPTARMFVNDGLIAVSKAQLIIETDQSREHLFPPPNTLILMVANRYGTPTSLLTNSYQEDTQVAYYQAPGAAGGVGNGRYVFDLTAYISELRNTAAGEDESLLLSLPLTELMSSVNRLRIAASDGKPAIKLHVTYVKL